MQELLNATFSLSQVLIAGGISFAIWIILWFFLWKKLEIVTTFLWLASIIWLGMVLWAFAFEKEIPYLFNIIWGMIFMNALGITTEKSLELFNIIKTLKWQGK